MRRSTGPPSRRVRPRRWRRRPTPAILRSPCRWPRSAPRPDRRRSSPARRRPPRRPGRCRPCGSTPR
ncbi:hypothetical protein EI982_10490 [Haloplanus rallus]|uniref:Uncharacterized protein n=1 Tax=Haloplanus rallus TaxID=1816183 RepID=A0A6B9FHV1_9EURY|nr:hypothetical protein EI982_10490 [Haloplanus rallus]